MTSQFWTKPPGLSNHIIKSHLKVDVVVIVVIIVIVIIIVVIVIIIIIIIMSVSNQL